MSALPTTLPASWFTSKAIYDLERRAVFLRTWILLGSVTRWPNVGEDYAYDMAQVKFNVRRGSTDWKSLKVYSAADGSEMRSHLTRTGLLFTTLSDETLPFDEFYPGLEDLIATADFTQFPVRRSLLYEGKYNWKTMTDGFQECLHCLYAHPAFSKIYPPTTYKVLNKHNYSQHLAETSKPDDGLFLYFFPNSTLNLYGGGMSSFRICPSEDPQKTVMEFDYYHKSPVGSEEFENYYKFARNVAIEDHELCEKAQENLNIGIYTEGILNPNKENGVSYYQTRVLELCAAQFEEDKKSPSPSPRPSHSPSTIIKTSSYRHGGPRAFFESQQMSPATQPPRQLLPAGFSEPVHAGPAPKPRHEKSRNGCVTCKARRRKCDEAKPSCSQCVRRRVVCGGYSKDLRWKEFEAPGQAGASLGSTTRGQDTEQHDQSMHPDIGEQQGESAPQIANESAADAPFDGSFSPSGQLLDLDILLSDVGTVDASSFGSFTQQRFNQMTADRDGITEFSGFLNLQPSDFDASNDPQPGLDLDSSVLAYNYIQKNSELAALQSDLAVPSSPSRIGRQSSFPLYQQPQFHSDSPENIALVYDRRICEVLCIKDDPTGNPWRRIVWPLAKEHEALYHAIAAMTCFQGANCLPQFRDNGLRHLVTSIQKLSVMDDDSMRLEVALAATLALGFAQTWYYPRSSTGISHIKSAKNLLQKALSMHLISQRPAGDSSCLGFLANTWIYMDVITRFTCQNVQALDLEFMTACGLFHPISDPKAQVDPLMGCAGTLFPLIGRVADLVSRVRKAQPKQNSPTIVSLAVELKIAIENWSPHIVPDEVSDGDLLGSYASDLTQTANAYKWATLLLLCQAVPELPIQLSLISMAQKVLVLLATVSIGSRVSIFQILPLMIAGCETTEEEDRDWVRDRWQALSIGNSSGIAHRCLELTLEVWKRRDSNSNKRKRCDSCSAGSRAEAGANSLTFPTPGNTDPYAMPKQPATEPHHVGVECQCASGDLESRAFSSSQDAGSGAGHVLHTVKSKLHWLSVMNDWGWEGK
ncbi:fungal-specific transcription factor domain-containing protein [Mariannaea sp. PMI_226]|nr:fungal-specific transcription factor domain-containing protein [Mariannaea sp. PMI_226]